MDLGIGLTVQYIYMSSALLQTEYKLYSQNLELFTGLLGLQCQACDPSEAEVWLPWQSPS